MIKRLVLILIWLIKMSEKEGLNIQPHSALIRGELLRRVVINFYVDDAQDYTKKILDRSITVDASTSMTAWEFKDQAARYLNLTAKYMKLSLADGTPILDNMHGVALHSLNLSSGDVLNAEKMPVWEPGEREPLLIEPKNA